MGDHAMFTQWSSALFEVLLGQDTVKINHELGAHEEDLKLWLFMFQWKQAGKYTSDVLFKLQQTSR